MVLNKNVVLTHRAYMLKNNIYRFCMCSLQKEEHCNAIHYIFNTCKYRNGILILLMIYSSLFRMEKGVLRGKTPARAHSSIKSREVRCLKQKNERESKPGGTYLEQRRLEISFHVRFCRVLSSVNYLPGCEGNPMIGEREREKTRFVC